MVYILFFIFVVIGMFLSLKGYTVKSYLIFLILFFHAIIAFRSTEVGIDTLSYVQSFTNIGKWSFQELQHNLSEKKEALYFVITWCISVISDSYIFYLFVWALFPAISIYKVLKNELSDTIDYAIAIIVCFILGLFSFYVAGIRQTAALSLILGGYPYLKKLNGLKYKYFLKNDNFIKFLLFVIVAFFIHNSSVIFVIVFALFKIKFRWWFIIPIIGLFYIRRFIHLEQLTYFSSLFFGDRFAGYGTYYESSQNLSAFIMQFILFAICIIYRESLVNRSAENNLLLNLLFVGLFFQSMSEMIAEMARLSFYFCMFAMILVPRALKEVSHRPRNIVYAGFVIAALYYLFALSFANLPEYSSSLTAL